MMLIKIIYCQHDRAADTLVWLVLYWLHRVLVNMVSIHIAVKTSQAHIPARRVRVRTMDHGRSELIRQPPHTPLHHRNRRATGLPLWISAQLMNWSIGTPDATTSSWTHSRRSVALAAHTGHRNGHTFSLCFFATTTTSLQGAWFGNIHSLWCISMCWSTIYLSRFLILD